MVDKDLLRKTFLEKRLLLSKAELENRNRKLCDLLVSRIKSNGLDTVHIFMTIQGKKEVDTKRIAQALSKVNPDVSFITSKTKPKGILEHYEISENTKFEINKWGIPEPVGAVKADISKIDLVLIPLVVFDRSGHRIGYGKGYYDRFLKQVPQAMKLGVSLGPPLDTINGVGQHDIAMDACCTPFEYYKF